MDETSRNAGAARDPIEHVVLLMLENHSFDQMLGGLSAVIDDLEGIDPGHPGVNHDLDGRAYRQQPATWRQMPDDPQHELKHVLDQIADGNGGFVKDFQRVFPDSDPAMRQRIMDYYPAGYLPALHGLAEAFTICDHWHASLPGPTWPNRFFALSGTSHGHVDMPDGVHLDLHGYIEQTQDTLFDRLNERGIHWKCYFHDIPQSSTLTHQRHPHNAARYFYIGEFYKDARGAEREFPQFSFIEPRYMGWEQNDDHPPHDVMRAEKLIADVYNALRANDALWEKTLLVVCYDEHGGFYDHVPPPAAVPPDGFHDQYTFDRLGVRVPALLVSPWVERRVVHTVFDHTSLLRYLIEKWSLRPLGERAARANSIADALTRDTPRQDTPVRITLTDDQLSPPDPEAEEKAFDHLNSHQKSLVGLASILARHLESRFVEAAPRWYAAASRALRAIEAVLRRLAGRPARGMVHPLRVSMAEPDRLSHHADAGPKNDYANFLMDAKQRAVPELARRMTAASVAPIEQRHALHTLSLITGRDYHREADGAAHAKAWLQRHGQLPAAAVQPGTPGGSSG